MVSGFDFNSLVEGTLEGGLMPWEHGGLRAVRVLPSPSHVPITLCLSGVFLTLA